MTDGPESEPLNLPIDGVLDLHTFNPGEVKELLPDYFEACLEKDITTVRIIHGKGTGTLRDLVHAQLRKSPLVTSFQSAETGSGGWGATIAHLKNPGRR